MRRPSARRRASGRSPTASCRRCVRQTVDTLNAFGVGRGDRVAIVLPNGPEMASSFLAVATGAATAPLNPAYRAEELDFYLGDLKAKALVLETGADVPARAVARKMSLPVLELTADRSRGAGWFTLSGRISPGTAARGGMGEKDDPALLLHTSGTTSRPKLVPLLQRNLLASADHIGRTLGAHAARTCCLNIMPLFHIHGLIAATLVLARRPAASVFCTPGFNALKFFAWLDEVKPTWYTAVPTMHQAILARAERNKEIVARQPAALHPLLLVVAAAAGDGGAREGVRRAGHRGLRHDRGRRTRWRRTRCRPRSRKPGSVGHRRRPRGRDPGRATERCCRAARSARSCIRGPNVTPGYENNPEANAKAFRDGWFRTGDQGVLDDEGYLRLTGRLKELINRGGEKISPLEVDEVLLDHPAVAQARDASRMPHDKLGEEVAAAVVLREGTSATERELRDFAPSRLADFKVPRKVVLLDEIPKGATGKLQRIGLAQKLGLGS